VETAVTFQWNPHWLGQSRAHGITIAGAMEGDMINVAKRPDQCRKLLRVMPRNHQVRLKQ